MTKMVGEKEMALVKKVSEIYDKISKLHTLHPSREVDHLFTELVLTCTPPASIDVSRMGRKVEDMRCNLIRLCGQAEGLLESHFSSILGSNYSNPLHHLSIFPYYINYLKLSRLEFDLLSQHLIKNGNDNVVPSKVAFIGSGPLPLTSIVLATVHLKTTVFHNYDVDTSANSKAQRLVASDRDLSKRMFFHTANVMDVSGATLGEYEVVFLAALVGMDREEKRRVVSHLARHMAAGAVLVVRSAHGARAFLYPVVDAADLEGFEVLTVHHPMDEVINSVVIARKCENPVHYGPSNNTVLPCKCSQSVHGFLFNALNHGSLVEELTPDNNQPLY